ncbi:MAG: response regulator transcription factor [Myxococcaceae bacterium]
MRRPNSGNTYVAVIDDDESVCRSLARLLRAAGIQAITYPSAEAFLADGKHPTFDCLVLDIQLPGLSGLELQAQLGRKGTPPIIFITAHDSPQARQQASALGCAGFFTKADSGSDVLDAIRNAVG